MASPAASYYRLSPGMDVITLPDQALLFRSDAGASRIEGAFAQLLLERVLPLLSGQTEFTEVAACLGDLPADELRRRLDELAAAGILEESPSAFPAARGLSEPLATFLTSAGVGEAEGRRALAGARVAIFGLEGHGARLAHELAACGFGRLRLVDPYPADAASPNSRRDLTSRAAAVAGALDARAPAVELEVPDVSEVSRESTRALAAGADVLVSCWDRGFLSGNHWVNRAALELGRPAIFGEVRGHVGLAGPMVIPGETACYMCARMREAAAAEDYAAALAYERYLDRRKLPSLSQRAVLPPVQSWVAAQLALALLRHLLLQLPPALAGQVIELDGLTGRAQHHCILQHPACHVCGEPVPARA